MTDALRAKKIVVWHAASAAFITQAVVLLTAYFLGAEAVPARLAYVPLIALLAGALAGFFAAERAWALLGLFAAGLLIGDVGALQLAFQDVAAAYTVAIATVGVFATLGIVIGAVVELVHFVHGLWHWWLGLRNGGPSKPVSRNA
jgi:hypothetical protein